MTKINKKHLKKSPQNCKMKLDKIDEYSNNACMRKNIDKYQKS